MKKRHKQKFVVLSMILFLLWNVPLLLMFNQPFEIFGFPALYFFIFLTWLIAIVVSFYILYRHYE